MNIQKDSNFPPNSKRVFKGELFEIWQWEQEMFDGSKATFERVVAQESAQVIAAVGDKILLQDQEQPAKSGKFLSLPGGRCEWDEDPLVCAKREFMEETGYASDDWELFQKMSPMGRMAWTIHTYIARECRKVAEPHLDAGEKIENRLITFDEFLRLDNEPRLRALAPTLIRAQYDAAKRDELFRVIFKK